MSAEVRLELPWPPSVNAFWQIAKRGRVHMLVPTKAALDYKAEVAALNRGRTPLFGRVSIHRIAASAPRASCDIDGFFKALFDSLNGVAWLDDNQVRHISEIDLVAGKTPGISIDIEGERFATREEVDEHQKAKAERNRKRKATLAKTLAAKEAQVLVVPGETLEQRLLRLARPAYIPARQP